MQTSPAVDAKLTLEAIDWKRRQLVTKITNQIDVAKQKSELIAWIDNASLYELLSKWRHAPVGDPLCAGEVGDHFKKVLFAKQTADPDEWTRVSKAVG